MDINGNLEVLLLILQEKLFYCVFEASFVKRVFLVIDSNEKELYQEVNLQIFEAVHHLQKLVVNRQVFIGLEIYDYVFRQLSAYLDKDETAYSLYLEFVYKHIYSIDQYFYIPNEGKVNARIKDYLIQSRLVIFLLLNTLRQT